MPAKLQHNVQWARVMVLKREADDVMTFGISKGLVPSPQALLERLRLRTCTHDSLLRPSGTYAHVFLS